MTFRAGGVLARAGAMPGSRARGLEDDFGLKPSPASGTEGLRADQGLAKAGPIAERYPADAGP